MRITVLIGFVVVALGVATPGVAQPSNDPYLIVAGQGIGPIRLGMSITDVIKMLGTPQSTQSVLKSTVLSDEALQGATNYTWSAPARGGVSGQLGFRITADATGTIIEIASPTPDERYHTSDGLSIGTREQAVLARLGAPSRTATFGHEKADIYDAKGVVFLIDTDPNASNHGLVNWVWVFGPHT